MFSAYMLDPSFGWIATHRLPFESAIDVCKAYIEQHFHCPVALVPDCEDPAPYLRVALGLPHYGAQDPTVQLVVA